MTDDLSAKIARQPQRFGMLFGFVGLPALAVLTESAVRWVTGYPPLLTNSMWGLIISHAWPGLFLGAQGVAAFFAWRAGRATETRWRLFVTGILLVMAFVISAFWRGFSVVGLGGATIANVPIPQWSGPLLTLILSRHLGFWGAVGFVVLAILLPRSSAGNSL